MSDILSSCPEKSYGKWTFIIVAQVGATDLTASSSRGSNFGGAKVNFSFVPKVVEGNLKLIYRFWGVQLRLEKVQRLKKKSWRSAGRARRWTNCSRLLGGSLNLLISMCKQSKIFPGGG